MGPEWFIIVWLSCPAIIKDVAPLADVCEFTWSSKPYKTMKGCKDNLTGAAPKPAYVSGAVGKCISIRLPGKKA